MNHPALFAFCIVVALWFAFLAGTAVPMILKHWRNENLVEVRYYTWHLVMFLFVTLAMCCIAGVLR